MRDCRTEDQIQGWPWGKKQGPKTLSRKQNKTKKAGDIAGVECLPGKCKAPSSNPSSAKKNKEMRLRERNQVTHLVHSWVKNPVW
jgi:hypothetical protein